MIVFLLLLREGRMRAWEEKKNEREKYSQQGSTVPMLIIEVALLGVL